MTELRHYEVVFLVHPDQSEQVAGMLQRYQTLVENGGGRVHRVEDWGRRQLAYTIHKLHKAHYALMNIECDGPTLAAFQEAFRFNDVVLRHLIIRREEALVEPTTLLKDREEKDAREREQLEQENLARRVAAEAPDGEAGAEGDDLPTELGIDEESDDETGDEADSDLNAFPETQH
ncbi:MAG: 30S ribosomal protein S6 [Gammaproteobacteria bacterium]